MVSVLHLVIDTKIVEKVSWDGTLGVPCGSVSKESACNAGELGLIPGLGRSPGGGNGNPLPYPCLENPLDSGAWWATVHGFTESQTQLNN